MKHNALLTSLTLVGMSILLVSCGQTPSKPNVKPREQIVSPRQEAAEKLPAPTEPEIAAMRQALTQAELALASGQDYRALSLVQTIQYSALNSNEQLRGTLLQAQLDSKFGSYSETIKRYQHLARQNLDILGLTKADIEQRIYQQAVLYQDHSNIVRYGIKLLLDPKQDESQAERLMAVAVALNYLDTKQATEISQKVGKQAQTLLSSIAKSEVLNRRDLGASLCQAWGSSDPLRSTLEALCAPTTNRLANNKILVALPLSGRLKVAGEAILDGIIFSHLSSQNTTDLHIIDTQRNNDQSIFQRLQNGQYTGMIGPLEKSRVEAWQSLSSSTNARIVSLNTPEQSDTGFATQHFYQLALSPEAESTYLANTVFASGARRIMIIRPQSDWGARTLLALRNRWQDLGGTEVATATFRGQEDYESSLRVALGAADSAARRRTLGRLSGLSMHLQTRRREDIDAVIMLASTPEEARSIVPLLAFHFAEDLPVYTLSSANDLAHQVDHKDLDKVITVDINSLSPIPNEIPASAALARLVALGLDAYNLSQLANLEAPLSSLYRGETGLLWIDKQGFVQRQWKVLKYDRDQRKAL